MDDRAWRLPPNASLSIRCWDQECVLFDGTTGETHMLGASDAAILDRFNAAPAAIHSWDSLRAGYDGQELEAVLADFEQHAFILRI